MDKPRILILTIVGLFSVFLLTLMSGCVSIPTHEKGVLSAYQRGLEQSLQWVTFHEPRTASHLIQAEIRTTEQKLRTMEISKRAHSQ